MGTQDKATKMTEARVFCETCQRWLVHDKRYCPLFPDVKPPKEYVLFPQHGKPGKKWTKCCCLIHTCSQAEKVKDREKSSTYHDFV